MKCLKNVSQDELVVLGAKMKKLRMAIGYTQESVAAALNISRSAYSYYESGRSNPDSLTLNRIAQIFKVSVAEFFPQTQKDVVLHDSGRKRASKKVAVAPQRIGDLTGSEKTLIAFLRDKDVPTEDALEILKQYFTRRDNHNGFF